MIKEAIFQLEDHKDLSMAQAMAVMDEIMSGQCSDIQISAYLSLLAAKGETADEILGSARAMRNHSAIIHPAGEVLEIVGTGGDHSSSFNISTTAAFIAASAGVPIAKHGNRSASSKSGAADCLEALDIRIGQDSRTCEQILENCGMCFLFAPSFHPAMKFAAPVRKELGVRTIFNLLGPLTSPARAGRQVMGVYEKEKVEPMARVLSQLGVSKGMVVYGLDKLDEISLSEATAVCEFENGRFKTYEIAPEQFGYARCRKEELCGGDPKANAQITMDILSGREQGAPRQAACLNAGAGLYVYGYCQTLEEGVRTAEMLIDSGRAMAQLEAFRRASHA